MNIIFSPVSDFPFPLDLVKQGDSVTINGEVFDFSPLRNGDTLPMSAITGRWFRSSVERGEDGVIVLTIVLPIPANASLDQRFPADLINVPDGPVLLPQTLPATKQPEESAE